MRIRDLNGKKARDEGYIAESRTLSLSRTQLIIHRVVDVTAFFAQLKRASLVRNKISQTMQSHHGTRQ